MKKTASN